jgi:hypothetical protein
MSRLRDIVRRQVESEVLQEFLGDRYFQATFDEQEQALSFLRRRGEIDREVEGILNAFLHEIEQGSTKKKKRLVWRIVYGAINLFFTALIAHAVNKEFWWLVWALSGFALVFYFVYLYLGDE